MNWPNDSLFGGYISYIIIYVYIDRCHICHIQVQNSRGEPTGPSEIYGFYYSFLVFQVGISSRYHPGHILVRKSISAFGCIPKNKGDSGGMVSWGHRGDSMCSFPFLAFSGRVAMCSRYFSCVPGPGDFQLRPSAFSCDKCRMQGICKGDTSSPFDHLQQSPDVTSNSSGSFSEVLLLFHFLPFSEFQWLAGLFSNYQLQPAAFSRSHDSHDSHESHDFQVGWYLNRTTWKHLKTMGKSKTHKAPIPSRPRFRPDKPNCFKKNSFHNFIIFNAFHLRWKMLTKLSNSGKLNFQNTQAFFSLFFEKYDIYDKFIGHIWTLSSRLHEVIQIFLTHSSVPVIHNVASHCGGSDSPDSMKKLSNPKCGCLPNNNSMTNIG